MDRRAAAALGAGLLALAAVACSDGGGGDPGAVRVETVAEEGLPIRTEARVIAGLRARIVRPVGRGPWPLVVWVHGAGAPPAYYQDLLGEIAAAGHVVVAPAMPGSVNESGMAAVFVLPFQPGRVTEVIDAVTTGPDAMPVLDPTRIVVAGHSLGAMTALAVGFNGCCFDPSVDVVDAVVAVAGQLATFPGGSWHTGTAPVLLVHGEDDDVVPYAGSRRALQTVGTSAYLLTVERGDHGRYLRAEDNHFGAVRDSIMGFLAATVGGSPQAGLADLRHAGSRRGVHLSTAS